MISRLFNRSRNPEERRIRAWCIKTLGITPGSLSLYREAFRHVSANVDSGTELPDNERLEFLGDSILDAIIGDLLFAKYKEKDEGFLTRMRSKLVSRSQLNMLAKHIGIEEVIESNVAKGHESSVPGNAVEALIGALFLDKGFERTRKVVTGLLSKHFDLLEIEKEDRDGKSRLLEWGQKRRKRIDFVIHEEAGKGRGKLYVCEVRINGEVKGSGTGASKKVAEQDAAQSAFHSMRSRRPQAPRKVVPEEPAPVQRQKQRPAPAKKAPRNAAEKKPATEQVSEDKQHKGRVRKRRKPGQGPTGSPRPGP